MTIYSNLQKKVSEYRKAQDHYWTDLGMRLIPFKGDLASYLGVEGKNLYTVNEKPVQIITFGRSDNEDVVAKAPTLLDKDEQNNRLEFGVKIALSRENDERVDSALKFSCNIFKKDNVYYVSISGTEIECPNRGSTLDFTDVFDYMIGRIHMHMDSSTFE